MQLHLLSRGAILHQAWVKDRNGNPVNVVAGFENSDDYTENPFSMGATIGRYAGRLSGGFHLDGHRYSLYEKNGVHLHGGKTGFAQKNWEVMSVSETAVTFFYQSPDGEENYPGNLRVWATYRLSGNAYEILYEAQTDKPTHVNITNHAYYNLSGKGSILNQLLQLNSAQYFETDSKQLPTGRLLPVQNSPFDFHKPRPIAFHPEFCGIDDCFLLENPDLPAAVLSAPDSGISMTVETDQPAVVVFTPRDFGTVGHKFTGRFDTFSSVCFETQKPPDAPNFSHFPSTLLLPDEKYVNKTIFRFDNC